MLRNALDTLVALLIAWFLLLQIGPTAVLPVVLATFAAASGLAANMTFSFARGFEKNRPILFQFVNKLAATIMLQTFRITIAALCSVLALPLAQLLRQNKGITLMTTGWTHILVSVAGLMAMLLAASLLARATGPLVNLISAMMQLVQHYDEPEHAYDEAFLAQNSTLPMPSRLLFDSRHRIVESEHAVVEELPQTASEPLSPVVSNG